jgi:hypothetical protein
MAKTRKDAERPASNALTDAQRAIESIFAELNIARVVYVDDLFERGDERLSVVIGLLGQKPNAGTTVLPSLRFDVDQDIWELDVRRWWDSAHEDQKDEVTRAVGEALGWSPVLLDHAARSALHALLPATITIEEIAPSDWPAKRETLAEATAEHRILCLFDRELGDPEVEGRPVDGVDLLVTSAKDPANAEVIFGLFSHGFSPGDERREWEEIAKQWGLNQDRFLPISKRRQAVSTELAAGLETMTLNMFCDRLKRATVDVFKNAAGVAADKFCELDVYEFESMVLRSSREEGLWEPDFLLRIFQIFHRDEVRRLISADAFAARVNEDVRSARAVNLNRPATPRREPAERWRVRHQELYEDASLVNAFHTPLRTGDLFQAGRTIYVLLAQPCDLAVRATNGKRKSFVAPLVQLATRSADSFTEWRQERITKGEDVLATRGLMQYFKQDTNDVD